MRLRVSAWLIVMASTLAVAQTTPPSPTPSSPWNSTLSPRQSGTPEPLYVCPFDTTFQPPAACSTRSLHSAMRVAKDNQALHLFPQTYRECMVLSRNNLTIEGNGAQLVDKACKGKAAIVVYGKTASVHDLSCRNISVSGENGSCVRFHRGDLTLDNVRFTDNESGLLGSDGTLRISNSVFARNGYKGQAHQVYFAGANSELYISDSSFLAATGEGHGIKSGARRLVLDSVVIDGKGGKMSRNIDAYNGGELVIRNSTLRKSTSDTNWAIIGYGYENRFQHATNRIVLENNVFDCGIGALVLVGSHSFGDAQIIARDNKYIGNCFAKPKPTDNTKPQKSS